MLRALHGTTGKRDSLLQFFENPEEKLPASSIVLFHASRIRGIRPAVFRARGRRYVSEKTLGMVRLPMVERT